MAYQTRSPVTPVLIAHAIGITTSTFLLGQNMSLSFVSIPAILQAPAPLAARQWHKLYDIGKSLALPLTAAATLSTAFVAYHQHPSSFAFKLNVAAAALFPAIVPFTFLAIVPVNDKLFAKEKEYAGSSLEDKAIEAGVVEGETVHALMDKWALLNVARASITGVGAVLKIWAALS